MIKRELKKLIPDTLAKVDSVDTWLDLLTAEQRRLEAAYPQIDSNASEQLSEAKQALKEMLADVKALIEIVRRLDKQKQTSQEAFNAGWRGLYMDLVARMTTQEYLMLRDVLDLNFDEEAEAEDDDKGEEEVPF